MNEIPYVDKAGNVYKQKYGEFSIGNFTFPYNMTLSIDLIQRQKMRLKKWADII